MIDKFSQVAENLPAADSDADQQYHVINGYPVVFSFSKEPNPEAFERIRNILLATSYTTMIMTADLARLTENGPENFICPRIISCGIIP